MPPILTDIIDFISSPAFGTIQIAALSYFGLLWLFIIIWVTRDSIHRSNSLVFQTFAILLNILIPVLGVIFYLIIRPSLTDLDKYYDELEHKILSDDSEEKNTSCEKCFTVVDKDYIFCPNCSEKLKKTCFKCKKIFPCMWDICPYCGNTDKERNIKKPIKRVIKSK